MTVRYILSHFTLTVFILLKKLFRQMQHRDIVYIYIYWHKYFNLSYQKSIAVLVSITKWLQHLTSQKTILDTIVTDPRKTYRRTYCTLLKNHHQIRSFKDYPVASLIFPILPVLLLINFFIYFIVASEPPACPQMLQPCSHFRTTRCDLTYLCDSIKEICVEAGYLLC